MYIIFHCRGLSFTEHIDQNGSLGCEFVLLGAVVGTFLLLCLGALLFMIFAMVLIGSFLVIAMFCLDQLINVEVYEDKAKN